MIRKQPDRIVAGVGLLALVVIAMLAFVLIALGVAR
jgi:hypothetical protein